MTEAEIAERFPRSQNYNFDWIAESGFGGNAVWQTEWLCEQIPLEPGMRVLDLGCGRAKSSVFLAREFDVEVWATDLWVAASENWRRVRDVGLERSVFPLHADARELPFAAEFFDAILAVDCYSYFGGDPLYLNYLIQFVKPGGWIGHAGAGLTSRWEDEMPAHLKPIWGQDFWALQTVAEWRHLWERTNLVDLTCADVMDDGWRVWAYWHRTRWPDQPGEGEVLEEDQGRYLGYSRVVGRRTPGIELADYAWPSTLKTFAPGYEHVPMEPPSREE